MRWSRKAHLRVAALVLAAVLMLSCGRASPTPTPTPAPARPPSGATASGRCGDGICDEIERADPSLCPQDCPVTATPLPKPPSPTPRRDTPTPIPPTAQPEPTKLTGKCGDGVCDETERANPKLCPQDCATPGVTVGVTPARPTPSPQSRPTLTPVTGGGQWVTLSSGELAILGDPSTVRQEAGQAEAARQANLALILDASGSMTEDLPGTGKTKLEVAKEVLAQLIPGIPEQMNGALWIYGHRRPGQPKDESCQDIEQAFALGPVDAAAYVQKIQGINAIGWTPIADSIEQAARGLPESDFNSIILVSDGEETCGGDPCALAEALKASGAAVTIHVVGYAVDDLTREQLQCIAQVSGGSYYDALDAEGLLQSLQAAVEATVVRTILRVETVDPEGQSVSANVYLNEAGTDRRVSAYRAWQDNAVPPGSYDLLIDTLPWSLYRNLSVPEGSTTIVRIVLGAIHVVTPDGKPMASDICNADGAARLGYYGHEGLVPLVPGTYTVKVNNSLSAPIVVKAGATSKLVLGFISVLSLEGKHTAAEVYDAARNLRLGYYGQDEAVALVPGTYSVKVNYSTSETIELESGATVALRLGAIHIDGQFEIWDASGARLGYFGDTLLLVPGTYAVKLADGRSIENIVVTSGRVTEVK